MREKFKMTPEIAKEFLSDYREGMSFRQMARKWNVAKGTIDHWVSRARAAGYKMDHRPKTVLDAFLMLRKIEKNSAQS